MSAPKYFRILSIDGGGIRGLIPAKVLEVLEAKLVKASANPDARIADYFDLLAGTSTRGILTSIYRCPDKGSGRPRFHATDAIDFYLKNAAKIFDLSLWQRIKSFNGYLDETYPSAGLEHLLKEQLGSLKLSELVKPCLITAYDMEKRAAYFFTQHDARQHSYRDFLLRDVARATSAAPTYFQCASVDSLSQVTYTFVDGGVFANNPALCAFAETHKLGVPANPRKIVILSLGTGDVKTPYSHHQIKDWGGVQWVRPIIDVLMSGTVEVADYHLMQLFKAARVPNQYLRIQAPLAPDNADLGNSEAENLHSLIQIGEKSAEQHDAELDKLVSLLTATRA